MPNNILITPGSASIQFSGSAANTIRLQVEDSGSIAFYGNSGSLFGITDSLSGSLMSVNDISGLPILEVFSDDRIVMGTFNKNTLVVTGSRIGIGKSAPTSLLDISGSVTITGSITYNSGGVTGSLFGTSSWASNAISSSFATTASAAKSITFTPSTASFATSASYALSASFAPGGGGSGNGFPFSGSAIITGSLIISSSGINVIGNGITGSLTSGSVTNITELSMLVSGTIPANGTTSVTLNLNTANYFTVSGSGTGTVTWAVTNTPPVGRVQTFVIEYTNGGIKTNNWFTNTRWPAGSAPSLTSASANPDMLSFTTDDTGSNWRGLLLQRGSA